MKRLLLTLLLIAATLTPGIRPLTGVAQAETTGPGGTPQLAAQLEAMPYTAAAPLAIQTYTAIVLEGIDAFPDAPSPEQVAESNLRKQLLVLRLMMDLNAFAYEPRAFNSYRDAVDTAYENMGTYQDLYVTQQIDGAPIDPDEQAARLVTMQEALAPFRLEGSRAELSAFFSQPASQTLAVDDKERPRLWQIAGVVPSDDLDSVANAALLAQAVLKKLASEGLTVDTILDPEQEARFHDARKAMRAIVDLVALYPSLSQATSDVQKPLTTLVSDYGTVNDDFVAYHAAQASGQDADALSAEVEQAYATARSDAGALLDGGHLDAYASRLEAVQASHSVAVAPAAEPAVMAASAPAQDRAAQAAGPASISSLQFASHVSNKGEPAGSRIEFSRDNDGVWVTFDYANLPAGSKLTRIVRFNGDDYNWDGNQFGHLDCCQAGGSGTYAFRVKRLDGNDGWLPGGAYDVRLYMNGSEVAHGGFGVNGARGSGKDEIPGGNNHSNSHGRHAKN
jgi:hypothetical protein